MKKNVLLKIVFITLVLFVILLSIYRVHASETFNPRDYYPGVLKRDEAKTLFGMGDTLLGTVMNIATVVSILTIAIIGVKYMFGSVDQKAEYKSSLLPWFIGAIVVFSITRIITVIQELATKI